MNRLVNNSFVHKQKSTINLELESKEYNYPKGTLKLDIWDTVYLIRDDLLSNQVGQERYQSLAKFYLKEASLAIIVFDVCQMTSFEDVAKWIEMIGNEVTHEVLIFVAGNKIDCTAQE